MTPCAAVRCAGRAVAAVQWLDLRTGHGTRAEPVCADHERILVAAIRDHPHDPWVVNAKIITLADYATRLAREPVTVRVNSHDAFADLMGKMYDAGRVRFPPPA